MVAGAGSEHSVGMVAEAFPDVELVRLSAGEGNGYRKGLDVAHERGFDWVWLLHEDAEADERALAGAARRRGQGR